MQVFFATTSTKNTQKFLSVEGKSTLKWINIAIKHYSLTVLMLGYINNVDQLGLEPTLMVFLPP
jgi:hypothetical protein